MNAKATFKERFFQLCGNKTQQAIADEIGVSRATIGYYMNGDRSPDIEILSRIAKYFNVTSDYLLGLSDNKKAENADIGERLGLSDTVIEFLSEPYEGYAYNPDDSACPYRRKFLRNIEDGAKNLYLKRREFLNIAFQCLHFNTFMYYALESKKCYEMKQKALRAFAGSDEMYSILSDIDDDDLKSMLLAEANNSFNESQIDDEKIELSKEHGRYESHFQMNSYKCEKAARALIEEIITLGEDNNADD